MKMKALLLGSAAALAVTGAQAADLSIAEPVDYVRVCDAFGVGYWYIPGTDTCLRIGGRARFEVEFHSNSYVHTAASGTHMASWQFVSSGMMNATAKSMTEHGILTGFVEISATSDNDATNTDIVTLGKAWLELGPLLAGHAGSTWNYGGAFTYNGGLFSDPTVDQVRLTWAMHGFGVMLGIEDPRDRWESSIGDYGIPDIVGAVTVNQGHWDGKVSVGFANGSAGSKWGIQAGATFAVDSIAPGDQFRILGGFADNGTIGGPSWIGTTGTGSSWFFLASFKHNWTSTLSSAFGYSYQDNGGGVSDAWRASANLVWSPYAGFSTGVEGVYNQTVGGTGAWTGKFRIQREWP